MGNHCGAGRLLLLSRRALLAAISPVNLCARSEGQSSAEFIRADIRGFTRVYELYDLAERSMSLQDLENAVRETFICTWLVFVLRITGIQNLPLSFALPPDGVGSIAETRRSDEWFPGSLNLRMWTR